MQQRLTSDQHMRLFLYWIENLEKYSPVITQAYTKTVLSSQRTFSKGFLHGKLGNDVACAGCKNYCFLDLWLRIETFDPKFVDGVCRSILLCRSFFLLSSLSTLCLSKRLLGRIFQARLLNLSFKAF